VAQLFLLADWGFALVLALGNHAPVAEKPTGHPKRFLVGCFLYVFQLFPIFFDWLQRFVQCGGYFFP